MIDLPLFVAFLATASLLTVTPGIDTALVLRAAASERRRSAVLAALGIAAGCLAWAGAVSLGIGGVLAASDAAYTLLKLAGAAYLLWLGVGLLRRPRDAFDAVPSGNRCRSPFARGLLTNLLNPKVGVFYVSFLPQFVPAGANLAVGSFLLACVHVALSLGWFALIIGATSSIGYFLRRPCAIRWLDRTTGAVLVGFGLRLAASSRG